jgi:glycosyltransferase involved in cell wall biosynthesis
MKICFVLPGSSPYPSGGVKILYEHANRLAGRGHDITIVHAAFVSKGNRRLRARGVASYLLNRFGIMRWRPDGWFSVDKRITMVWAPSLDERWIPAGDAVIASSWQTAEWVRDYPETRGRKFYFMQDFERYMEAGPELRKRIAATYTAGFRTIVISPACREVVEDNGGKVCCEVPNGLDFRKLALSLDIDHPERTLIGFPTRPEGLKATEDAVAAIEQVRSVCGEDLAVWSFGGTRPAYLPAWVRYHERPGNELLCDLYNHTAVFVVPSRFEGWGLPGSEAMACGAALVSTENGGVRAYAEHGRTALLCPVGDREALAAAVCSLLSDRESRIRLARAGFEHIRQFTWERASRELERCLLSEV